MRHVHYEDNADACTESCVERTWGAFVAVAEWVAGVDVRIVLGVLVVALGLAVADVF